MHSQYQSHSNSSTRSSSRPASSGHSRPARPSRFGGGSSYGGGGGMAHGGFRRGPSHGGSRFSSGSGGFRGGRKGGRHMGQYIDPTRFINKAVITETAEVFVPQHAFADFAIDERLKQNVIGRGYVTPTPIQDRAIPHALRNEDVVGIANTGTGKTAAFLIPLIDKIIKNQHESVLIMAPTRELAIQIEEELRGFVGKLPIYAAICVGGTGMGKQISDVRRKPHFVIGTPGRLKDLIERGVLKLAEFKTLVLDEADRMLDMGFIADVRGMVAGMDKDRHTLFFSATMTREIEGLISEFLNKPVAISVKTGDTSKTIDQDIVRITAGQDKFNVLVDLLKKPQFDKVIIFGRTKHGVEKLAVTLQRAGIKAESIHGNKNHSKRQSALGMFKKGGVQALVATDVAARGLDISGVSHVINYDIPATYEDYVHRIGRTGRAGKTGIALTFIE